MNFRRLPFQFTATDPVERQRELEKRFGLPSSQNMYVDMTNPLSTGISQKETCSPRLQHRVPIFLEGCDQPVHSSVDSMGSNSENKKPNVRVIPIEIEGAESKPTVRHRTYSGPAGIANEHKQEFINERDDSSPLKRSMVDLSKPSKIPSTGPRVHNIPIQVEGVGNVTRSPKVDKATKSAKKESSKANGYSVSKSFNKVKSPDKKQKIQPEANKTDLQKTGIENSLKKIENVLEEFKTYEAGVKEFNGTTKDKQYRYLDEMLTRCMLRLDDIDTMGNENVRSARKNAVKTVQASIDLLESKATTVNEVSSTSAVTNVYDENEIHNQIVEPNDVEMKDSQIEKASGENESSNNNGEQDDIEMSEDQHVGHKTQEKTEVTLPEDKAINDVYKIETEKSNEVPEIEMSEVTSSSNIVKSGNEICEVEMTENLNIDADVKLVGESLPDSTDVQVPTSLEEDLSSENEVCEVEITEDLDTNHVEIKSDDVKVEENEPHSSVHTASSNNLNIGNEINEVEMAENYLKIKSDKTSVAETASDSHNVEVSSSATPNDIEMNVFGDTKDTAVENTEMCTSSQSEEQIEYVREASNNSVPEKLHSEASVTSSSI